MATAREFVDYLCDQMRGAGQIASRRMFGEFAIYCDEKVVALVCDNQLFLKPTAGGRALLEEVREGFPFPGARVWWVITAQLEDPEALTALIRATAQSLPTPGPKPTRGGRRPRAVKQRAGKS